MNTYAYDDMIAELLRGGFEEVLVGSSTNGGSRWIPLRQWLPHGREEAAQGINFPDGQMVRFYLDQKPYQGYGEACIRETNVEGLLLAKRRIWPIRGPQQLRRA